MELARVLEGIDVIEWRGPRPVPIDTITHDSRAAGPGALFCCVPGSTADGHDFAAPAVAAGAAALLCERVVVLPDGGAAVPQVVVRSVRAAMGPAAANLAGHPSRRLAVCGVTGTNGKTTTTHLLAAVLEAAGRTAGVIGTLSGARTTPEAPELQARLAAFADGGKAAVAMEVSSHALVQHRVDGTVFAVAAFTNLSQDHLDYHRTMEEYFAAKARLFQPGLARLGVVNADDPWGQRLLAEPAVPTRPFSLSQAHDVVLEPARSRFRWEGHDVRLRLGGQFNVANALCAAEMARALDIDDATIAAGLSGAPGVPGRFEPVDAGQSFAIIVDYAHTPDALEQVLAEARHLSPTPNRVIVVFGCGGDRDREKRPAMGHIATTRADVAVLTNDNPRSEDPAAILDEVRAGADGGARLVVEPDRAAAIAIAVTEAKAGDLVLIAGKGHETGQTTGSVTVPFDDREVARAAVRDVGGSA